nr:ankyrin repeat domain-containing protein [Deltaproteobacteria bacterium]
MLAADEHHGGPQRALVRGRGERRSASRARAALAGGADARYAREESGDSFRVETPVLFIACTKKHPALVELLLAHGADPDACFKDDDSWHQKDTCLRGAMPSLEIVTLLLERGADPNQPSEAGESCRSPTHALEDAAENAELTALLLKRYGADLDKMPSMLRARPKSRPRTRSASGR